MILMSIELQCNIEDISDSRIPDVKIMDMSCSGNVKIKMDIHRKVNLFSKGDKVTFLLSTSLPKYEEGKDFVAHGYVIAKRIEDGKPVLYISLWGFLVIITLPKDVDLLHLNVMDKVYVKISHSSTS